MRVISDYAIRGYVFTGKSFEIALISYLLYYPGNTALISGLMQ